MLGTYENLSVVALNAEQHAQTCNYWYLVQDTCYAHTAFTTRQGLERWLDERGLTCEIPTAIKVEDYGKGLSNRSEVVGKYKCVMHFSMEEFYALPAIVRTKTLSNGDYVDCLITQGDGFRTQHVMNPNVKDRKVYEYRTTTKEMR